MPTLEGDHGRRIVVEHDWVDYYVHADSPQRRVRVLEIDDLRAEQHTRRKFVAFGAKEPFVTVSVRGGPTFFSMTVTGAEGVERARAFVDELRAHVATARARTA